MRLAAICPSNQWTREEFHALVDHNEQQEVRVAAAYGAVVDVPAIRIQVVDAILRYVIPAGNA